VHDNLAVIVIPQSLVTFRFNNATWLFANLAVFQQTGGERSNRFVQGVAPKSESCYGRLFT
jgi:hypothetical protein